jgi:enoyl-CoA hydratase/carnithine racemase
MSDEQLLIIDERGPVSWVTLNRPDRLNTLAMPIVDGLVDYFRSLQDRPEIRIVVLKANGKHFCAGLDLEEDADTGGDISPQIIYRLQKRIGNIYRAMRACPQPIIALVQGAACGGGFSLALASDIRIAGESAKMNAAYIRAGFSACDMGCSYFLPRLVGLSVASELMMTGRFIHAERALRTNLVSEVVPDDMLVAAAQPYIDEMLATTPMGLRLTKEGLNHCVDAPGLEAAMAMEDRQQALTALTGDSREAMRAFLGKRTPEYLDR